MSSPSLKETRPFHDVKFVKGAVSHLHFPADDRPFVLFAGRSNCGKSSLLNALAQRHNLARVSKTPGRTTEANFFDVSGRFYLVDLPGYGFAAAARAKRAEWDALADDLFADPRTRIVLLLIDIRRMPDENDRALIEFARSRGRTLRYVLTRRDKIGRGEFSRVMSAWRREWGINELSVASVPCFVTSSKTKEGIAELAKAIEEYAAPAP